MDTVTQMALGAAIGEATLGRRVGNKAIVWSAIVAGIPDLDILVPFDDVIKSFTYHRSVTHSLLVLALTTPLVVWLITRIHPREIHNRNRWLLTIFLAFASHPLLDCFTAYGTQIFWPLPMSPVAWSSIFIIDPIYSLPMLVGVICALVMSRETDRGHLISRYGLIVSSIYLGWTVTAKTIAESSFEKALREQNISYTQIFTTPSAFNSLLWRAVARADSAYYEGYYSVFDTGENIRFQRYPSEDALLANLEDHWPVERLKWFTLGFYSISRLQQDIIISDLRMGIEPHYVFRFKVAELDNPHPKPVVPEYLNAVRDWNLLSVIWARIWSESVYLGPRGGRQLDYE